jgi:hypothetical protein
MTDLVLNPIQLYVFQYRHPNGTLDILCEGTYISNLPILKTACELYTRKMHTKFRIFQKQFTLSCNYLQT